MQETRVQLSDSKYDALEIYEPEEIRYLNFAQHWQETDVEDFEVTNHFTVLMYLTNTVQVQKRNVYSFSMMLGDGGGLYDLLRIFSAAVFSTFSQKFLLISMVE